MSDDAESGPREFPDGSTPGVRALRAALPTSRHAEMLLDMAQQRLGDHALLETSAAGNLRVLFRRARHGFVPWPLLRYVVGARQVVDLPFLFLHEEAESWKGETAPEPPPPPAPRPRLALRGLTAGQLTVYDGPEHVELAYGEDGRCFETSRSASPAAHHAAARALASGTAGPAELVVEYLVGLDHGRHGAGRVHYPAALPCGIEGAWNLGLAGVRRALFEGPVPLGARWVVADGYAGTVVAWGPTRDAAFEAWRAAVKRSQPTPPPPRPIPQELLEAADEDDPLAPGSGVRIEPPGPPPPPVVWPVATLENTPAALLPIPVLRKPPPLWTWSLLVGARGTVVSMLRREDDRGFTLLEERVLRAVDLAEVDRALDEIEVQGEHTVSGPWGRDPYTFRMATYRVLDEAGARAAPRFLHGQSGPRFDPGSLDADGLRGRVTRFRRIDLD